MTRVGEEALEQQPAELFLSRAESCRTQPANAFRSFHGPLPGRVQTPCRYLELPPSLAKIRHEQLCRDASQAIADHLRTRRYVRVRQLLPASKLQHLFKEAGAGEEEVFAAVALLRELRSGVSNSGGGQPLSSSSCMATSRGGLQRAGVGSNATSIGPWGVTGRLSPGRRKSQGWRVNGRRKPLRISVGGLKLKDTASCQSSGSHGVPWDPRMYASRGEVWFKPPESIVKRRWDEGEKVRISEGVSAAESVGL